VCVPGAQLTAVLRDCAQESEGYAKVLTVLNNCGSGAALSSSSVADVVRTLQSLIGCFDLDPNRVFDLVLDRCALFGLSLAVRRARTWRGRDESRAFLIPSGYGRAGEKQHTMDRLV